VTALLFGTYNARHAANAILAEDLRAAGWRVAECHEALWERTRDKDARYFSPAGLARLAGGYARAVARLARRFRAAGRGADVLVAGFNGQLDVILLRRLAGRRPILFAPLVTVTETLVDDRGTYAPGSAAARLLRALDRASLSAADLVLVDTAAHRDWAASEVGLDPARTLVQYLGAEAPFEAAGRLPAGAGGGRAGDPSSPVRVLFYGQYLPLHGTEVIARAIAAIRPEEGIAFELVGTGTERPACEALLRGAPHVRFEDWVDYGDLPARLRSADVVLGIFGSSQKARMVVPNKVWQAAAVGRAIVTADTPAIREVFVPGESIRLVASEPGALAGAIRELAAAPVLRERLAVGARVAALRSAGADVRAARLREALGRLLAEAA
jgi:glycosyltransferase involved in cell wall biosynthesis